MKHPPPGLHPWLTDMGAIAGWNQQSSALLMAKTDRGYHDGKEPRLSEPRWPAGETRMRS